MVQPFSRTEFDWLTNQKSCAIIKFTTVRLHHPVVKQNQGCQNFFVVSTGGCLFSIKRSAVFLFAESTAFFVAYF